MANPYYSAVDVALLGQVNNVLDTALLPGVPTQRGASGIITVVPPLLNLGNATNAQLSLDTAALPVSTATQTALNLKLDSTTAASTYAPLASPALTGTPTAPTASVDTNTTQVATTAFVLGQASSSGDGTPSANGTAARGSSTHYARADHVHATDTSLASLSVANTFSVGPQTINTGATTNKGLIVNAPTGQSVSLAEWQVNGSAKVTIKSDGTLVAPSTAVGFIQSQNGQGSYVNFNNDTGGAVMQTNGAANKGLAIRGAASQTADLIQTQTLAGTVLGGTNAAGQIYTGATTAGLGFANATTSASAASTIAATYVYAATSQLVQPGVLVTTNNFQPTYFNGTFAVTSVATVSAGSSYSFTVVGSGFTASGTSTTQGTWALPNQMTIVPAADAVRGLVVKQYSSNQNGDLQQWQNAAGTALASVNQTGVATFPSVISSGNLITGTSTPYGRLTVFPASTQIGAVIRGAASQTANVQEWQDSNAALLAAVRSDGKLKFATANTATTVGAAGSASVLPAIPVGYIQIDVNGTLYKLPYYNN